MEVWKKIEGYEDYEVSSLGNVRSIKFGKERKVSYNKHEYGYLMVVLFKNGKRKMFTIHQLVAVAFLNHNICGYKNVINHKNFITSDNRVENLEIVTARENSNKKHIKSSSKYTGVSFHKRDKVWQSIIFVNGKNKQLGSFKTEIEAHNAYQDYLKTII